MITFVDDADSALSSILDGGPGTHDHIDRYHEGPSHLEMGIQPGGRIRLDLIPDGRAELKADSLSGSWRALNGMLKGKGNGARLSIEELNEAAGV